MRQPRPLRLEQLENRMLMAGNVRVEIEDGTLYLRGDTFANAVAVHQVAERRFIVTGFAYGSGRTRVNGSFQPQRMYGVFNDINANMHEGSDILVMHNHPQRRQELADQLSGGRAGTIPPSPDPDLIGQRMRVPRDLVINTQGGDDGIGLDVVAGAPGFGGFVRINTDEGHDQFLGIATARGSQGRIFTGEGNDRVSGGPVSPRLAVIITGGGNDKVELPAAHYGQLNVELGAGDDLLTNAGAVSAAGASFDLGDGIDQLRLDDLDIAGLLLIHAGKGSDQVQVSNSESVDATIELGVGNNKALLENNRFTGITIVQADDGQDQVTLDRFFGSREFYVFLERGADRLVMGDVRAVRGRVFGGLGVDTFDGRGGNDISNFQQSEFERFV
jgi:hypothetical protein